VRPHHARPLPKRGQPNLCPRRSFVVGDPSSAVPSGGVWPSFIVCIATFPTRFQSKENPLRIKLGREICTGILNIRVARRVIVDVGVILRVKAHGYPAGAVNGCQRLITTAAFWRGAICRGAIGSVLRLIHNP
jgi:hypothetical protein